MEMFGMPIDQASEKLGKLDERTILILDAIKDVNAKLTIQNGSIAKAHARIDAKEAKDEVSFDSLYELMGKAQSELNDASAGVRDWRDTKKRGIYTFSGICIALGATGSAIKAVIVGMFG